jgi:hypothetical protein
LFPRGLVVEQAIELDPAAAVPVGHANVVARGEALRGENHRRVI